ncbi:MAG: PAS domain S-box protein [Proteobacteria bacterium]|nr:PAS domain S-box protein [Pseudomonadota bacterium]
MIVNIWSSMLVGASIAFFFHKELLRAQQVAKKRLHEISIQGQLLDDISHLSKSGGWELDLANMKMKLSLATLQILEVQNNFNPTIEKMMDFYPPDGRSTISAAVGTSMKDGTPFDLELPLITAEGKHLWTRTIGKIISKEGKRETLLGSVQDITRQKEILEALKSSEQQKSLILNNAPDQIWLKDTEGIYLDCNPIFERYFRVKKADIIGKTDFDFVDRTSADSFRQSDRATMIADEPSTYEEWIIVSESGQRALMETTKSPMKDSNGKTLGVLGVAHDITKRYKMEKEIRRLALSDPLTGIANRNQF